MTHSTPKRLIVCGGEPAGSATELCLHIVDYQLRFPNIQIILLADIELLRYHAHNLNVMVRFISINIDFLRDKKTISPENTDKNTVLVYSISQPIRSILGQLEIKNVSYVLNILTTAHDLCSRGLADAVLTLPIHKGIINSYLQQTDQSQISSYHEDSTYKVSFSGHTEFFQRKNQCDEVVMLLACERIKVALATTHLPLKVISQTLTQKMLEKKLDILRQYLMDYKLSQREEPRIAVLALNPHAGEDGYLGLEEQQIIQPVVDKLKQKNWNIQGVFSADTAFLPPQISFFDCYFGMYHDQVLPIFKHIGFHQATNITLGLPYPRISVDHGTALDIVGHNKIDSGSLLYSLQTIDNILSI